jgi:hypothetical protein
MMSYLKPTPEIKPTARESLIPIRIGFRQCPHCGAPRVPERLPLTPVQRRIVDVVRRRGEVNAEDLRCAVWADDEDGGPLNDKTLHVHIYLLNKKLRRYGLAVRANKGAGATYKLRHVHAHDGYDADDDIRKSVAEGFRVIRERMSKGGAGWGGA